MSGVLNQDTLPFPSIEKLPNSQEPSDKLTLNKPFRLSAKNLFFTYPRCPAPKEHIQDILTKKLGIRLKYMIVCNEAHEDEGLHSHVTAMLNMKSNYKDPRFADIEYDGIIYHGNYKSARDLDKSIEYCKKQGNYIEFGDYQTPPKKKKAPPTKKAKSSVVAEMLMVGKSLREVNDYDPGYFLMQSKNILQYKHLINTMKIQENKLLWARVQESTPPESLDEANLQIYTWLLQNILNPRELRQKQLWIVGEPGCGKTTLYTLLENFLRLYIPIYETDYLENYDDEDYDLVVYDEFKGQKTLTFLNSFIDGSYKRYNVKFGSINKKKNIPVIFLSNFPPTVVYSKAKDLTLDAFVERLLIVQVDTLYSLLDHLKAIISPNCNVTNSPNHI